MRRLFKVGSDRHDKGKVVFTWHPDGMFLASAGKNGIVHITDRHGDVVDEIPLPNQSAILDLKWDRDGEMLAILQENNATIPLWTLSNRKIIQLDTNLKDPCFITWSKTGPQLAIGTIKGNLLIYNKTTKKRVPIVGLHAKKIQCGAWTNNGNKLALGSEDKTISISDENGDSLFQTEVKQIPIETHFMCLQSNLNLKNVGNKMSSSSKETDTLAALLDGKSLLLMNILNDKEDPLELSFATENTTTNNNNNRNNNNNNNTCKYGDIKHFEVFDDNLLLVGFSQGYVVTVPASGKNLGQEMNMSKFHNNALYTMAYNPQMRIFATAGDDGIRIIDIKDFKESRAEFVPIEDLENGKITSLYWSPDGQILTAATINGNIYNFLAKINAVHATNYTYVAYLSSLCQVEIINVIKTSKPIQIGLKLEPSFLALGTTSIAAGMNNKVYYHSILPTSNENNNNNNNNQKLDNSRNYNRNSNNNSNNTYGELIHEQEYAGTVRDVKLNDKYTVVLLDNKAIVHLINPHATTNTTNNTNTNANATSITFPMREEGSYSRITCVAVTDSFLYYGTEAGTVEVFCFLEWCLLPGVELRLTNGIKQVYPNYAGIRVVIVDNQNNVFLYNPVTGGGMNQSIVQFDSAPSTIVNCLWDLGDKNVIMLFDGKFLHTYIYTQTSMNGSILVKLGPITISDEGSIHMEANKIEMISNNKPITTLQGMITCQTAAGGLLSMIHPYFDKLNEVVDPLSSHVLSSKNLNDMDLDTGVMISRFCQAIGLNRLEKAWQTALVVDQKEIWLALGGKALELLNVELAIRVYRQLKDAGMVMFLQTLRHTEDQLLLSGYIAMLFNDYSRAQELFLASSQPEAALQMRRDLLQWDQALKLARALASTQIPDICVYYAQQLEHKGDNDTALRLFESSLLVQDMNGKMIPPCAMGSEMYTLAVSGIARCNLRLGNLRQGMKSANEIDIASLYEECGDILEQQKQYQEAADMHLKAFQYERAAFIYTKYLIKNNTTSTNTTASNTSNTTTANGVNLDMNKSKITEAAIILQHVRNDQLNTAFAKACMNANRYQEACDAYSRAKDLDKVIELKLRYLTDQIQDAFDLVRTHPSEHSAQLVSDYCLETNNLRGAIEFLLLANKNEDAYKLAQSNQMVDIYADIQGDGISPEDALKVAHFFEKTQNYGKAGRFYAMCTQYSRALKLFIQCGDKEIDAAIDVVGKSQNETLTHQLIDFLVGETDGIPKDSNYIYKLYIALKKYDDAAKTALIISSQEQEIGNYTLAHSVLFETAQFLEEAKVKVPQLLRQRFILLHSYILVKGLVKMGEHIGAARLLQRVAQNVSKFPQHIVPILTSAVIECQRANMKVSCYEFAVQLMKPEHRVTIDPNLKRKIEAIVRRKTSQNDELDEILSKCPICSHMIPEYQLECPTTRDALPMCVVTGKHMLLDDWTFCPVSKAPALFSEYIKYINNSIATTTATAINGNNENSNIDGTNNSTANERTPRDRTSNSSSSGDNALSSSQTTRQNSTLAQSQSPRSGTSAVVITALDPVLSRPVSVNELIKCSSEEASQYIKKYNNVIEEKKKNIASDLDAEEEGGAERERRGSVASETGGTNIHYDENGNEIMNESNNNNINSKKSSNSSNTSSSNKAKQQQAHNHHNSRFRVKKVNMNGNNSNNNK